MFFIQLPLFLSALAIFAPLTWADWLDSGPTEYNTRCGLQSDASGEYVCFTSPYDITTVGATGNYQGYASSDGLGFALVPQGSGAGDTSLMSMTDRRITITWQGDSSAHVLVERLKDGSWGPFIESDTTNPNQKVIYQL